MHSLSVRFARQLLLPGFDLQAQESLSRARILVVGCGGLGHPVLQCLTAAGVGTIGIADADNVALSNLHRQTLFNEKDIGRYKILAAVEKLRAMNVQCKFPLFNFTLTQENILEVMEDFELIIDCTDNFQSRYLLDDACAIQGKTLIYAALHQFEGQVCVFNASHGFTYRSLFPTPAAPETIPGCDTGGVLGSLTGMIGNIQAHEAIKCITGVGQPLLGRLLIFNSRNYETHVIQLKEQSPDKTKLHALMDDYDAFCGITKNKIEVNIIKEISIEEYQAMLDNREDFQLIDVREPSEFITSNLGGELIPLGSIPDQYQKISRDKKVVIHCKAGMRSSQAIQFLQEEHGYSNLYNLSGGIMAWLKKQS